MKALTINEIKNYQEDFESVMVMRAANFDEKDIQDFLSSENLAENIKSALLEMSKKVVEMAKPYAQNAMEFFQNDKTDEDIIKMLKAEGYEEGIANAMSSYLSFDVIVKEMKQPVKEAIEDGQDYDSIIDEFQKHSGLEKEFVEVIVYAIVKKLDPDKMAKSIQHSSGIRKIRSGLIWGALGGAATLFTEGEYFFIGAIAYGVISVIYGLYLMSK